MNNILYSIIGILIPFVGTCLGSFFVFFLKNNLNIKFQKLLVGIASGVMMAASIWSLIIPSINMAENSYKLVWLPATIGFLSGIIFLIIINKFTIKIDKKNKKKRIDMLLFSVTLHNIPEGMAVGVAFAGFLSGSSIDLMGAMLLSIGIAIQNIPEGAIISMPLKVKGNTKMKSFIYGVLSGIVEPIAAFLTVILIRFVVPLLPYLLAFAAGAMIHVVIEELIPEMHEEDNSSIGIIGVSIGFIIMMILDVALS